MSSRAGGRRPTGVLRRFRRLTFSFGASGTILAFTAVGGIILARVLGPAERGQLATIVLWPTVVLALGGLGLQESVTYLIAGDRQRYGGVVGAAMAIAAALSVVLTAIGALIVWLIVSQRDIPAAPAFAFLAFIPLSVFATASLGALNGFGSYRAFQVLRAMPSVVTTTIVVALAVLEELTVATGAAAYLAGSAIQVVALIFAVTGAGPRIERGSAGVARDVIEFGFKSYVSGIPGQLNYRLDQMLISLFMQPAQLGLYGVAVTLMAMTAIVGTSVQLVVLPAMARARELTDRIRLARRSIVGTLAVSSVVSAALIAVLPWLIPLLFGDAFEDAVTPGRILLVAAVALSVRYALDGMLKGVGQPLAVGFSELVALAVTLVTLPPLLVAFGISGAAIATTLAYVTNAVVMSVRLAKELGVRTGELVRAAD